MIRTAVATAVFVSLAVPAAAHHGGGTFDGSKEIELTGTFTGLDLINPHSWIYFDVKSADGKVTKYRCEMRAATVLRRSAVQARPVQELGFLDYSKTTNE